MSIAKRPTTIKELKAALEAMRGAEKCEVYEGDEIMRISLATIKARKRTVVVL